MTAPAARIGVFVAGLLAVFGIAFGVGSAVGPWDVDPAPSHSVQHNDIETEVSHDGH